MMGRRVLLFVDGLLMVGALFLGFRLYDTLRAAPASAPPETSPAVSTEAPAPPPAPPARPPLAVYGTVAERNLFSASRTETPPEPPRPTTGLGSAPPAPRPRLHGIVLLPEGRGRAYLEDVQRQRVAAYSVGDLVGDSRVEQIKADRVVLRRGGETFEVLLYDPAKPRQGTPPPGVQSPETGGTGRPAIVRPRGPVPPPGAGPRVPVRPRVPVPTPSPPPSVDGEESTDPE